jgi:hypothetical protein
MIDRRFTLICLITALAGTLLATLAADVGRTPRDWRPPCDLLGADGCRPDR